VHLEEPGETELPEASIKNKDKTTDLYCMSFRGFLDAIKAQSATAPEEADDEESKDGKPKDDKLTLKLEMQ